MTRSTKVTVTLSGVAVEAKSAAHAKRLEKTHGKLDVALELLSTGAKALIPAREGFAVEMGGTVAADGKITIKGAGFKSYQAVLGALCKKHGLTTDAVRVAAMREREANGTKAKPKAKKSRSGKAKTTKPADVIASVTNGLTWLVENYDRMPADVQETLNGLADNKWPTALMFLAGDAPATTEAASN